MANFLYLLFCRREKDRKNWSLTLNKKQEESTIKKLYFLHGFMGTANAHFTKQIAYFKEKYELILIDLPGHGNAPVDASDNYFEETLNYVIAKIQNKGEGYVIGLSLGASLAIHIALRVPELVRGIVLTGYSPFIPEELEDVMQKQYEYFSNIEEKDAAIAEHFMGLHGERWKRTLNYVNHTMTFHYPEATKEHIQTIKVPVLLLNGSNEMYEVNSAAYIKKVNKDILVGLVPNAGHTANIDQPDIYNKIVDGFLKDTDKLL